jgi:Tol biopolymer transport system component
MKAKIITLFMILSMLFATATYSQEIDPGTGVKIGAPVGSLNPAWSPDGKFIASAGDGGLYLTSVESRSSEKIYTSVPYNQESRDYGSGYPCFSPDGKEIYFETWFVDKSRGSTVEGGSANNILPVIMAVNIETKTARVVREEARCAKFSFDGRYFGYINYDHRAVTDPANAEHHYAIGIFDTVTQETRYVDTAPGTQISDFSFSSDNTYVAAIVYRTDHTFRLYKIPVDGSQAEEILSPDNQWGFAYLYSPRCSPDGRWIMFQGTDTNLEFLLIYNTETKETKPFFPISDVKSHGAEWSPDGKKILCSLGLDFNTLKDELYIFDFIENNIGIEPVLTIVPLYIPKDFGTELAKIDLSAVDRADSSIYEGLSFMRSTQHNPIWSPDGKWVAITCTNPGTTQNGIGVDGIWLIPSQGGTPIRVCDLSNSLEYKGHFIFATPTLTGFTPDSQEILFFTNIIDETRGTIVTIHEDNWSYGYSIINPIAVMKAVNIYTGAIRLVMDAAWNGIYSHNGRYFLYVTSYPIGVYKLMLYDTETQQTRKLADKGDTATIPHFADDDSYIIARVSGSWKKINLDGETITNFQVNMAGSISPDERFILYTLRDGDRDRISLYDIETKKSEFLTPKNAKLDVFHSLFTPSFSPDGKKICYVLECDADYRWQNVYVKDINLADYTTVTSVETEKPSVFALQGNYPNPFNPSTTIQFSLATAGKVNLTIYNVAGQKIRELVKNAELTPGIHHVLWDGHDDLGKPVSSGVYLSKLQMGSKVLAGRMLLMK